MSTLHTVNKPGQPLELCLRTLSEGDAVLLIEEGVYLLLESGDVLEELSQLCDLYALEADLAARGLAGILEDRVKAVSYERFVQLTESHDKVISWF